MEATRATMVEKGIFLRPHLQDRHDQASIVINRHLHHQNNRLRPSLCRKKEAEYFSIKNSIDLSNLQVSDATTA